MAESKVVYTPRANATPESELSILVAAYRFLLFDCNECEKGACPDDTEGLRLRNDCTDTEIIPR